MTESNDRDSNDRDTGADSIAVEDGPLAGIRVVELSMYVQGPIAGLALASLGADVVKIERVGQVDQMRQFRSVFGVTFDDRGRDWLYASVNRNKRSLALDITSEAGRPVFRRLIEQADVFVTNMRAVGLELAGADADSLMAINPKLVYCRGGGFGLRGPLADDPCQDTVGMAFAGFMDTTAPDQTPNYPPGSMSDILTGTNMAAAIMAGLLKRGRTGKGCVVGTSQTEALLWLQSQGVGLTATTGRRMERFRHDTTTNPLFTVYRTADGWIAIAALAPPQWPAIAEAVGLAELLTDPRFATLDDVIANRDDFRPKLADHLQTKPTDYWWQQLRRADVWVAPVNRVEDLVDNEHIAANEYLVTFDDGFVGPPVPFEVDGFRGVRGLAADYAQHTDEVLAALGYDEPQILELKAVGAVW
jgi:crotonobetainyl-CoA:carnitine CoA-transferase CaiB-like acyl-CoA transferase